MNTTTETGVRYEVAVTPSWDENLRPRYECRVIADSLAGVSGPVTGVFYLDNIDEIDGKLSYFGFRRFGWFSEICGNGFATVQAEKVG
jgi:hypothetical protein